MRTRTAYAYWVLGTRTGNIGVPKIGFGPKVGATRRRAKIGLSGFLFLAYAYAYAYWSTRTGKEGKKKEEEEKTSGTHA